MKLHKNIELVSNLAIIVVSIVFVLFVANRFLSTTRSDSNSEILSATSKQKPVLESGAKVSIPNLDLTGTRTLVVYVRKGCKFCDNSLPFYKHLIEGNSKSNSAVVFVSQDDTKIMHKYLEEHSIATNRIYKADLSTIGVRGTPTLLLLDSNGKLEEYWIGQLSDEKQLQVLEKL
ncbi:MAG: peroxiredoxin family protein [Pyrinomonadaceae bacterium]